MRRPVSAHAVLLAAICSFSAHAQQPSAAVLGKARSQVVDYLHQLGNLHCNESVLQQKLAPNGHVQTSLRSDYDYLIMMDGDSESFQLNESRIPVGTARHSQLPLLVTNGFSTLMLIFHPYYTDTFRFERGADELVDGRPEVPVHFTHLHGRRTLVALALRGREYPIELQGTAWLDKATAQVLTIDAELQGEMTDIGLRSLKVHVEYRPIRIAGSTRELTLPIKAVVDVTTPRQHWRNTHVFSDYKLFGAVAEQDPNVKVKPDKPTGGTEPQNPNPQGKP